MLSWASTNVPLMLGVAYGAFAILHPATRRAAFPLVMALIASAMLAGLPQAHEALELNAGGESLASLQSYLALAGLGILAWYTARRILEVAPDNSSAAVIESMMRSRLTRWWSCTAAGLPLLGAAYGLWSVPCQWSALAAAALAVFLILYVSRIEFAPQADLRDRESATRRLAQTWQLLLGSSALFLSAFLALWLSAADWSQWPGVLALALGALVVFGGPHQWWIRRDWLEERQRVRARACPEWLVHRPKLPRWLMVIIITLWLTTASFGVFVREEASLDLDWITWLGSVVVFCLGAATVLAVGSLMSFWVARDERIRGGVVVTGLIVWAAVLAGTGLSENHRVWKLPGAMVDDRPSVETHLNRWLRARRNKDNGQRADRPIALVVAAGHGGGIRAAYWTGLALAKLEGKKAGFHQHVFAVAGVSGSSLGALVWRAALSSPPADGDLINSVERALSSDFLAATIAGAFAPDILARFVPDPLVV